MKNEYFRLVKIHNYNKDDFEILACIKKYDDRNIWADICNRFLNTKEYAEESHKDPYGAIYHLNLYKYLECIAPDVINLFDQWQIAQGTKYDYTQPDIAIYLASSHDYAKFDEQFDNEMKFLEYMNSEYSEMDKMRNITPEILLEAGFEYLEDESKLGIEANKMSPEVCSPDYKVFRKWTEDKDPSKVIKLDIDNGYNNRGTGWHLHIDNNVCETIGCADIDTVWEFNTLMQVFKSKFRL